jgi:hypothetical protein
MNRRVFTLLLFFIFGATWLALDRLIASPERPTLIVRVPADTPDHDLDRLIDEAVLTEVGLSLGWRTDPLIRDRVQRIAANVGTAPATQSPLDLAESLDLPRRDPLIRARLIERARKSLPEPDAPPGESLATFFESHRERFMRPLALTFEHRFTRDPDRATHLMSDDRGEPELMLGPRPTRTLPELSRTLGTDAATQIANLPIDRWSLIRSPLGHHAIRLLTRHEPHLPPLTQVRPEVLLAWREAHRPTLHQKALRRLREGFDIDLRRLPSPTTEASR